jgi:hypothetical protein
MKEWEQRYMHERDVQIAFCKLHGIPVPKEETFGVLKRVKLPETFEFNGKRFWPILNELGHTKTRFEDCDCIKEN